MMNDTWLNNHHIAADDIQTEEYEKATQSGLIHELKESAELRDCMGFFKQFRQLGLVGGTHMDNTLAMVGDSLIGLDYALRNTPLSLRLLKKMSRKKERHYIDKLMKDADEIRERKASEAQDYLRRRAPPPAPPQP